MSDADQTYTAEWDMIESSGAAIRQFRQKVVGGWLVVCSMEDKSTALFLADPDWSWNPPVKVGRKKSDGFF
jgi:hypothetical protein